MVSISDLTRSPFAKCPYFLVNISVALYDWQNAQGLQGLHCIGDVIEDVFTVHAEG